MVCTKPHLVHRCLGLTNTFTTTKTKIFAWAKVPILVASLALGGSVMPGCTDDKEPDETMSLSDPTTPAENFRAYVIDRLMKGVSSRNMKEVKGALAMSNVVNVPFGHRITALMLASAYGHKEMVELLISKGADVNAKEKRGLSPLAYAISKKSKEIAKILIANGADVNLVVPPVGDFDDGSLVWSGGSLLELAAGTGNLPMVKLLVEKGADLEARYEDGRTPLLTAAANGDMGILQYLYARGADRKAEADGENAIILAIENRKINAAYFLINLAKPEEIQGIDELRAAARLGYVDIAKKLVAKGADFRETYLGIITKGGVQTPLMAAAAAGKIEMMRYLLKTPWVSAINAQDEHGETALILAVQKGNAAAVRLLLEADADMNLRNNFGKAALSYAEDGRNKGVYNLLSSEGAKY